MCGLGLINKFNGCVVLNVCARLSHGGVWNVISLLLIASQNSFIGCVVVGLKRLCPVFRDGCVEYFHVVNASMAVLSSSHVECMRVCTVPQVVLHASLNHILRSLLWLCSCHLITYALTLHDPESS
jgi:hypothetical protein